MLDDEMTSGTPTRLLRRQTFAAFDLARSPGMKPAFERALAVAEKRETQAFFVGGPGNGKTHLARAAMNVFGVDRSYFWKAPGFLEWIRERCVRQHHSVEDVIGDYLRHDFLLVFDDLGTENATDWANEQLYRVLDARYELELPTIITTNASVDRIDARIRSRYRAGKIVCEGEDQR